MTPTPSHAVASRLRRALAAAMRSLVLVTLAISCSLGSSGFTGTEPTGTGRKILFIGNSLTYTNDLPAMVRVLAASAGESLAVAMVAYPDYNLEDHLGAGEAPFRIQNDEWDVVVLQQGPSSLPENRENLRSTVKLFDPMIRAAGARPALYSVWPQADRQADFARAIESYALAAQDVGGILFPVAEAWLETWRNNPGIGLYAADGLHPNTAGTYLAALVIYGKLTGRSPVGLPGTLRIGTGTTITIAESIVPVLQLAAQRANEKYPD